ncbi:MAG: protein kinase [Elusimicrobiales bacterium]|jgi:tetratricopeptide (TPR) repeat protein/tRNA A-37 threonylcarbamoyl transferase component Bud32
MAKLFFGPRVFLLALAFAGGTAFCGEAAGGKPGAGPEASSAPDMSALHGGDYRAFRENLHDSPDLAARALIRLLNGMPPDRAGKFISRHIGPIAEMVLRLDLVSGSGLLGPQEYDGITSGLAPFRLDTVRGRERSRGGHGHKHAGDRNPFDDVVDARKLLDSGDRNRSAAALKALKEGYPDDPGVQSAVARYYNEIQQYGLADKAATDAILLDPEDPDSYKARALARISLQDRKGAIEDISRAMEMDPQDESAKILAALVDSKKEVTGLKSLSSLEAMRKDLGGGLDASGAVRTAAVPAAGAPAGRDGASGSRPPDYARSNIYLKTASTKSRLGDYEEALKYAGLAIERNPANLEAYLERANAQNFLGRYDEAVKDTTFVIGRDPASAQALNMRAWALNRKGMSKDAEADADKAISLNPDFADAWFNRALAYEKQGNYKRMLEDFRQAAFLNSAYGARFQDAVAQYAGRVPDSSYNKGAPERAGLEPDGAGSAKTGSPVKRFLILLVFTLTGGLLVALGLLHIVTSSREKSGAEDGRTHPEILAPSIFYEGVATGKYKIERRIGSGGMGIVYEATDQSLERKVAIKKMNDEIRVDEREKRRFLEEARTVALLHHPNIVEIYTIFEEDGNVYLVFEHVNGVTLDRLLDREVQLPFSRARKIFAAAAEALSYAHSKNVVHRDLKLSNIMISFEGEVKVMDFGLARHAQESLARVSNREVVGSPAYMPPEQDLGVSSKESDIYSLGVCLYEALTGGLPFKGPDFHYQKERELYQPAGDSVPGLPPAVDELIARALSPDPGSRFKTAEELRAALLAIPERS